MFTAHEFLFEIRSRGATRLKRVAFRENRNTVWSLTGRGSVLNLHAAYRAASPAVLDAFATIVRQGGISSRATREAAAVVSSWSELAPAIEKARALHKANSDRPLPVHCCATPEQRAYLKALYRYFNVTRFGGRLPDGVPVRLSNRMKSSLGHMRPGEDRDGRRQVAEIALNVDLMLEANAGERVDTLLHEMAHIADYLLGGNRGHGDSWRKWARKVGCRPTTLYDRPVARRRRRSIRVTRVPPLPPPVAALATIDTDALEVLAGRRRRKKTERDAFEDRVLADRLLDDRLRDLDHVVFAESESFEQHLGGS